MIPKRALGALLTTVFALALLLSFKTPASPDLAASTSSDSSIVGEPTASATPSATADTATTTDATPAPTATDAPATTGAYIDGTVAGPVVSTRFGDVQVQVTIAGGVITDVVALELPSGDHRSADISAAAEPLLREAALTAQSADIDLLSGATYTSRAYAASLQAALDAARS
jgi:uncharacterized protein with FMN-binding domain